MYFCSSLAKYCDDHTGVTNNCGDESTTTPISIPIDRDHRDRHHVYHGVCPDVSNRYEKVGNGRRIGQGTYGVVYRARDTWNTTTNDNNNDKKKKNNNNNTKSNDTSITTTTTNSNKLVALKKCYAHHESSDGFPITTLREINALRVCSAHPNIVNLLQIAVSSNGNGNGNGTSSNSGNTNTNTNTNEEEEEEKEEDTNDVLSKKNQKKKATTTATTKTIKMKGNIFLVFENCQYDIAQILDAYYNYRQQQQNRQYQSEYNNSTNNNNSGYMYNRYKHNTNSSNTTNHRSTAYHSTASTAATAVSPFTQEQSKVLIYQLLSAIEFCHRHCLIHRDIKTSNLLYSISSSSSSSLSSSNGRNGNGGGQGQLKLCDFGLSRTATASTTICGSNNIHNNTTSTTTIPPMTPNVVSLWYRAPELLLPMATTTTTSTSTTARNTTTNNNNNNNKRNNNTNNDGSSSKKNSNNNKYLRYSYPIDIWPIGCVMGELLQGYPLLDGTSEIDQIYKITKLLGGPSSNRLYHYSQDQYQYDVDNDNGDKYQKQNRLLSLWDKFDYLGLSSEGLTLLTNLLEYDPQLRWNAKQALESTYFTTTSNENTNTNTTSTTSTETATATISTNIQNIPMPKRFHFME